MFIDQIIHNSTSVTESASNTTVLIINHGGNNHLPDLHGVHRWGRHQLIAQVRCRTGSAGEKDTNMCHMCNGYVLMLCERDMWSCAWCVAFAPHNIYHINIISSTLHHSKEKIWLVASTPSISSLQELSSTSCNLDLPCSALVASARRMSRTFSSGISSTLLVGPLAFGVSVMRSPTEVTIPPAHKKRSLETQGSFLPVTRTWNFGSSNSLLRVPSLLSLPVLSLNDARWWWVFVHNYFSVTSTKMQLDVGLTLNIHHAIHPPAHMYITLCISHFTCSLSRRIFATASSCVDSSTLSARMHSGVPTGSFLHSPRSRFGEQEWLTSQAPAQYIWRVELLHWSWQSCLVLEEEGSTMKMGMFSVSLKPWARIV